LDKYGNTSQLEEISRIFQEFDQAISHFQNITGLGCPPRCGACCGTMEVEATVLETLHLADAIFNQGEAEMVLDAVEAHTAAEDISCVLFRPDPEGPGNGRCGYYADRPLLCRLFGFAARRNRLNELEICTCRHISEAAPDTVRLAQSLIGEGISPPVYQDSFMRIASLNPAIGFERRPINLAIKEAVEYLYWRRLK
jgi:uncharacterized protein